MFVGLELMLMLLAINSLILQRIFDIFDINYYSLLVFVLVDMLNLFL